MLSPMIVQCTACGTVHSDPEPRVTQKQKGNGRRRGENCVVRVKQPSLEFQDKASPWGRQGEMQRAPWPACLFLQALLALAVWAPQYLLTAAAAAPAVSAQPILSAAAPPLPPLSPLAPHQRTGHPLCLASRLPSTTCSGPDMLQPGEVVPHPLQHPAWIGRGVFLHLPGEAELSIQDTTPTQGSPGGPVTQHGQLTALPQPESSGSRVWAVSTTPQQW